MHPQSYLMTLYEFGPDIVTSRIHEIAEQRGKAPEYVLSGLAKTLPMFAELVAEKLGCQYIAVDVMGDRNVRSRLL